MSPLTPLVDIDKCAAFDAKIWVSIVNDYQPVGISAKQLRTKVDKFWDMYFQTYETRWLNLIAVCHRELQKRCRVRRITTSVSPLFHT